MAELNKPKPQRDFMAGYRTYDPAKEGFGSVKQWSASWESMGFDEAVTRVGSEDPLAILGFTALPSYDELKRAYRKLIMKHHPDAGGDEAMAKKIIAAYTVLEKRLQAAKS